MNKRVAIPVITVLASAVIATGYFVVQQSNKLGEAGSEIVALEQNVSALEENVSTLEESGSVLEVKLTDLEAKVSTLEADLDKANDDVELQQKLVGCGACAEWTYPGETDVNHLSTGFFLTNPDGVSEITIDRVSIFDLDGTVLYEGPLIAEFTGVGQGIPYTEPMKPHEQRFIVLYQYLCDPEIDIRSIPCAPYTVEIFWTKSHWRGLPLIGWSWEEVEKLDDDGNMIQSLSASVTEMVNMKQRVGP